MFGEDTDRGGAVSFADLERKEAERFSRLLVEVDNMLYTPVLSSKVIDINEEGDGVRRYYSEGYEANYEGVDNDEVKRWQQGNFSYLRVEGVHVTPSEAISNTTYNQDIGINQDHVFEDIDLLPVQDESLIICGRSIMCPVGFKFADTSCETDGDEAEYFAQHGILEEYIEYNGEQSDNNPLNSALEKSLPNPLDAQKEEVLVSMLDAVWPDVVHALKPLIADVLVAAKENNIPYLIDQNLAPPANEYGDNDGFDFASDDDGW